MHTFSQNYDETIRSLESRLSTLIDDGSEFDFTRMGDVLTIEFENDEKIVITPQAPMEQLWVSANYAGHRFNWNGSHWQHEKSGESFSQFLSNALSEGLGTPVDLSS
ncbi:MAG TPA: iron donor protein CyaY [Candidatus Kapabacteria bacterium]|jgi:iron donor protein CyaY